MEPQPAPAPSRRPRAASPWDPFTDPAVEVALQLVGRPREEALEALLEAVEWQREPLERARDALIRRLDRRSDDFEASKALRFVYEALTKVGWPGHPAESRTPRRARAVLHRMGRR